MFSNKPKIVFMDYDSSLIGAASVRKKKMVYQIDTQVSML
jgi:hypothetical protein